MRRTTKLAVVIVSPLASPRRSAKNQILAYLHSFGWAQTIRHAIYTGAHRIMAARRLAVLSVKLADICPHAQRVPGQFRAAVLAPAEVGQLITAEHEFLLPERFARTALSRGDTCVGIFAGRKLVATGWYSCRATEIFDGVAIQCGDDTLYAYKLCTDPALRGNRLMALGLAFALKAAAHSGRQRVAFCVEVDNKPSLRSARWLGATRIGTITYLILGRRLLLHSTQRLRNYGIRVSRLLRSTNAFAPQRFIEEPRMSESHRLTSVADLTATLHWGMEGLELLRQRWLDLLPRLARRHYFHEWGWYAAYLSSLSPDPAKELFVLISRADRSLAIVPLTRHSRPNFGIGMRELCLPEHDHVPLADIISDPELGVDEMLTVLTAALRAASINWDVLRFTNVMRESALCRCQSTSVGAVLTQFLKTCDQVRCDLPWDTLAAGFSANFRSNLNKARNKLAKESDVVYTSVTDPDILSGRFATFLDIEASGWKGAAGSAIALDARLRRFYEELMRHFGPQRRIQLNELAVSGKAIASQFCLLDTDTVYILKLGYDESQAKLAPGNSLIEWVIRQAHASGSVRFLNLVGNPPWFAHWKPESQDVFRIVITNRTMLGRLLSLLLRARSLARRLRTQLSRSDT